MFVIQFKTIIIPSTSEDMEGEGRGSVGRERERECVVGGYETCHSLLPNPILKMD
jgi:hypothetical protein